MVSGRIAATCALFRLGCPLAAQLCGWLTCATAMHSPDHSTKGTPSTAYCGLWLLVSTRFQALFHSPLGVLFTFPSRYSFTIGCMG